MFLIDHISISCLFPLFSQQLECCRDNHLPVALATTFKADIFIVTDHLQTFESAYIIIGLTIFTRHAAPFTAGHMYMLQVLAGREESGHIAGLLPSHVPEVAQAGYSGIVDVTADRSCIGNLTEIESLFAVQRLQNYGCSVLLGNVAHLVELFAEEVTGLLGMRHDRYLRVECRYNDNAR